MTSLINIVGVEVGSKINFIMVSIQVVIIVAFLIFTIKAITEGMGEGTLASFSPFYNPDIDFSYTVAGAAAACYCFLGFDALTTFTEDTIDPTKNIPRSIILTLLVCGAIFLVVTYFTHLVHPSFDYPNPDNAAYDIAKQVAPSVFGGIFLLGTIAGQFAAGLSAQASGARLLYAMGRDGVLPKKFFGNLNHKTQTPVNAIILTGVVALFAVFLDVTKATAYINFGGFVAFFYVSMLEKNKHPQNNKEIIPSIDTFNKVARAMNISLNEILEAVNSDQLVSLNLQKKDAENTKTFDNVFPISVKKFPLLGEIACGEPIFANEDRESYIMVGTDIDADFCLKAKGDSMIGARILDGDIVFIKKTDIVDNSEIAAVAVDDEVLLKRFEYSKEENILALHSENPRYSDIQGSSWTI